MPLVASYAYAYHDHDDIQYPYDSNEHGGKQKIGRHESRMKSRGEVESQSHSQSQHQGNADADGDVDRHSSRRRRRSRSRVDERSKDVNDKLPVAATSSSLYGNSSSTSIDIVNHHSHHNKDSHMNAAKQSKILHASFLLMQEFVRENEALFHDTLINAKLTVVRRY